MLRIFIFQTLMFLRPLIRFPLLLLMFVSAIITVIKLAITGLSQPSGIAMPIIVFGSCALLRHYYDMVLLAFAPSGQILHLPD